MKQLFFFDNGIRNGRWSSTHLISRILPYSSGFSTIHRFRTLKQFVRPKSLSSKYYHTSLPNFYAGDNDETLIEVTTSDTFSSTSSSSPTKGWPWLSKCIPAVPLASIPANNADSLLLSGTPPWKRYVRILSLDILVNPKPTYRKKEFDRPDGIPSRPPQNSYPSTAPILATSVYSVHIQPRYITIHNSRILREIGTHRLVNIGFRTENFYTSDSANTALESIQNQLFRFGIGLRIVRSNDNSTFSSTSTYTDTNSVFDKNEYEYYIPDKDENINDGNTPKVEITNGGNKVYTYHWKWLCGKYGDERCFGLLVTPNSSHTFPYTKPEILRNWHIPITTKINGMSLHKYQARADLLFSKTLPIAQGTYVSDSINHNRVPLRSEKELSNEFGSSDQDNLWSFHTLGTIPTIGTNTTVIPREENTIPMNLLTPYEELDQKDTEHRYLIENVSKCLPPVSIKRIDDVYIKSAGSSSSTSSMVLMTDGCAPAGSLLFDLAIQSIPDPWTIFMKENGYSTVELSSVNKPTVVQGRLGGYKGLWYWDPTCTSTTVTVRPSQEKINYSSVPHKEWSNQLQFELIKYNKDNGISSLNRQFGLLLEGWGVPARVFMQYLDNYTNSIRTMTNNPTAALQALNKNSLLWMEQQSIQMIQHGLWNEYRLMDNLRKLQKLRISQLQKRIHVPIPQSRTVFILADPTGLLQEGEIYYRCSNYTVKDDPGYTASGSIDEISKSMGNTSVPLTVQGSVILLRNPCYHPEHLVVAKGIRLSERMKQLGIQNTKELKHMANNHTNYSLTQIEHIENTLMDVILMPIQGNYCMAARLSGGDYDGDTAWICWNRDIVDPVHLHRKYTYRQSQNNVRNCMDSLPIVSQSSTKPTILSSTPTDSELQLLWQKSYQYRMDLGSASNLHTAYLDKLLTEENRQRRNTKHNITESTALWNSTVQYLSRICDLAVDIPKTGQILPPIDPALRTVPYPAYLRLDKEVTYLRQNNLRTKDYSMNDNTPITSTMRTLDSESVWGQLYHKIKSDNSPFSNPGSTVPNPVPLPPWLPSFAFGNIADSSLQSPSSSSQSLVDNHSLQPHPVIVACANQYQWWKFRNEAAHHRILFNQDTLNYQKVWKTSTGTTKTSYNYSSGDDSSIDEKSSAEDNDPGPIGTSSLSSFSSTTSHRKWLRDRNRTRFLMKSVSTLTDDKRIERDTTERISLAFAYYMVTWEMWQRTNNRLTTKHNNNNSLIDIRSTTNSNPSAINIQSRQRYSPPSFPWIIADDYILLGIQMARSNRSF